MADQTFRENLERFRRRYAAMRTKLARGRVLDGLCGAFGFERKHLGKLLRGKRGYRHRSFGAEAERLLLALREESGWLCDPYLKAAVRKLLADPGNPRLPALWKAYGETNSILLLAGIRRDIARIARACVKSRNAALGIRRAALPAKEVSVSTHLSNRAVMAKK